MQYQAAGRLMNKQPWPNLRYWKLKTLSCPCANHEGVSEELRYSCTQTQPWHYVGVSRSTSCAAKRIPGERISDSH